MFYEFILQKRGYEFGNYKTKVISKIRFEHSEDGENWTKCPDEFITEQTPDDTKDHQRSFVFPTPFRAKKARFYVMEKDDVKYGGRFEYVVSIAQD